MLAAYLKHPKQLLLLEIICLCSGNAEWHIICCLIHKDSGITHYADRGEIVTVIDGGTTIWLFVRVLGKNLPLDKMITKDLKRYSDADLGGATAGLHHDVKRVDEIRVHFFLPELPADASPEWVQLHAQTCCLQGHTELKRSFD